MSFSRRATSARVVLETLDDNQATLVDLVDLLLESDNTRVCSSQVSQHLVDAVRVRSSLMFHKVEAVIIPHCRWRANW